MKSNVRQIDRFLWMPMLCVFLCLVRLSNHPVSAHENISSTLPRSTIGTEGVFFLRTAGIQFAAKPSVDDSPMLIRIAEVVEDGESVIHEIRYIGLDAGVYDLCDFLQSTETSSFAISNQPSRDQVSIEESPRVTAMVSIVSVLPPNHGGELGALAPPPIPWALPYRVLLALAGLLWLTPVAWWIKRRLSVRPDDVVSTNRPAKCLAQQLEPLVAAVIAGRSSPRENAMLERLLIGHWRTRLNLKDLDAQQVIATIRMHAEAGVLFRQLDAWLYMPPGRETVDVVALLEPYRDVKLSEHDGPFESLENEEAST